MERRLPKFLWMLVDPEAISVTRPVPPENILVLQEIVNFSFDSLAHHFRAELPVQDGA